MGSKIKLLVCGESANAHAIAGYAASRGIFDVKAFVLDEEKAELWNQAMEESQFILRLKKDDGETTELRSTLELTEYHARACVTTQDVIVLATPSSEHEKYLTAMQPYIPSGAVLVGMPSGPGFEFQCWDILKEKFFTCNIVSCDVAPWEGKIVEYGKIVEVMRSEKVVNGAIMNHCRPRKPPFLALQMLFGSKPSFKPSTSFLEVTIMSDFLRTFYPVILHADWRYYHSPLHVNPPLFHGISTDGASMAFSLSEELQGLARALAFLKKSFNKTAIINLHKWLILHYGDEIEDDTSTYSCLTTNAAFKDIMQPMCQTGAGRFIPDYDTPYMTDDLVNGLCVIRGIADLANVPLPSVDDVIVWCQQKTGKEYLIRGKFRGKDIASTRAPQRYNITTFDGMFLTKNNVPHRDFTRGASAPN